MVTQKQKRQQSIIALTYKQMNLPDNAQNTTIHIFTRVHINVTLTAVLLHLYCFVVEIHAYMLITIKSHAPLHKVDERKKKTHTYTQRTTKIKQHSVDEKRSMKFCYQHCCH